MGLVLDSSQVIDSGRLPGPEETRLQVDRILLSPAFRNAPLLQRFLEFITTKAASGLIKDLGEYTIATEVLGRPSDFDPASDTIVRTQAYRLRTKLKEYYESEGKCDSLVIEIPKGHYVPSFCYRQGHSPVCESASGAVTLSDESLSAEARSPSSPASRFARISGILAAVLLVICFLLIGGLWGPNWFSAHSERVSAAAAVEPLNTFWSSLISGNEVILAYTNSVFFETETGDLLRFGGGAVADRGALAGKETARATAVNPKLAERAGPLYYEDGYTGTGEVIAVHQLTSLLASLGVKVSVKRSRLVTAEDMRNHDVIFLGSPFENQVLAETHFPQRFVFKQPETRPYLWQGRIVDTKAVAPATSTYQVERDPQDLVIRADYALFDVLPGPVPGRKIIILAGLTTSGTQGASEFATSAEGLRQVLESLGSRNGKIKIAPAHFECLLRVEAAKGLDVVKVSYVSGAAAPAQQ